MYIHSDRCNRGNLQVIIRQSKQHRLFSSYEIQINLPLSNQSPFQPLNKSSATISKNTILIHIHPHNQPIQTIQIRNSPHYSPSYSNTFLQLNASYHPTSSHKSQDSCSSPTQHTPATSSSQEINRGANPD